MNHENNGSKPIKTNPQSDDLPLSKWARLIQDEDMSRLMIEGVTGWSALTAVAAVMESPRMEVMLGLDAGDLDGERLGFEEDSPSLRYAVCVDGPIEEADAKAIEDALVSGGNLLEADIRTAASVLSHSGLVEIQSRDKHPLLAVVAEMIRSYVSQIVSCHPMELPLPDPDLINRLMSATGRLAIRPLETDVYPDFVDLGVVLQEDEEAGPANTSVVFDLCSRTWHSD